MKKMALGIFMLASLAGSMAVAQGLYLGPSLLLERTVGDHSGFTGLRPGVTLGYGVLSDQYYLAAEFFTYPFSVSFSDVKNSGAPSAKITAGYGVSILPGMPVGEHSVIYLRLGAISSRFAAANAFKTGGQIGAGFHVLLNRYWNARAEYIYTTYQSVNGLGSPKSNQVGFSLLYNLDA